MAIPLLQMYKVARYIAGRKLRGDKRYPLVLMVGAAGLFQCNLARALPGLRQDRLSEGDPSKNASAWMMR